MEYRFIHHWQYEPGEEENKILESALALSERERGEHFLFEAAAFIAHYTGVEYVSIGRISQDQENIHTSIFLKGSDALENITYPLQGTPCETVKTHGFCYFPFDVTGSFPHDRELQELQIESYLGSLFLSDSDEPIGIVALMDTKPIRNAAFAEHLIFVLSPAIEEELAKVLH